MEDTEIVSLYLKRDEQAIRETSKKYGAQLQSLAYHVTEDSQTAEECLNDAYLKTWQSIPPNEPREYLFPYLAKIVRQVSFDAVRYRNRKKRSAQMTELSEELEETVGGMDTPESETDAKLLMEEVSKYLKSLPKKRRIMFVRRYYYMDSISQIAEDYHVKEANVRLTLYRIRNGLKKHLKDAGYENVE